MILTKVIFGDEVFHVLGPTPPTEFDVDTGLTFEDGTCFEPTTEVIKGDYRLVFSTLRDDLPSVDVPVDAEEFTVEVEQFHLRDLPTGFRDQMVPARIRPCGNYYTLWTP